MKTKEFNLSKRRLDMLSGYKYAEKDVKEFIKKFNEDMDFELLESDEFVSDETKACVKVLKHKFSKLAGDKLI